MSFMLIVRTSLTDGTKRRLGDVWISPSMLIKCANDVEIEETSLCNCETLCIFAIEF